MGILRVASASETTAVAGAIAWRIRDEGCAEMEAIGAAAVNQAVVAEKHGAQKPGASGISIYFPNSELYRSPVAGPQSYTVAAGRFAQESLWDDFLAYHYTKRPFQPATTNVVVPGRADTVIPVGSGGIQVSPVRLSRSPIRATMSPGPASSRLIR